MKTQNQVWDIYTRLFHWLLVLGIAYQWVSMELLDDAMEQHALVGYGLLSLILWRIIWGFIGPHTVRFRHFSPNLKTLFTYLRAKPKPVYATHNPLGSIAVLTFFGLILVQSISGLFMTDDIFFSGPLLGWLDTTIENVIQSLHDTSFDLLVLLILVHILAVVWHVLHAEPYLIKAMFHGKKPLITPPSMSNLQVHTRALVSLGIAITLVYCSVNYLPQWLGINPADDWDF